MAKFFRMLSPFAVVTGNVSGAQNLEYPLNGGSAFDAPAGSKQYAQNYKPRFVMHERKSDGQLYFQLRQRSCVHKTTKSILAMAALGATGAIVGSILANKTSALYIALQDAYATSKPTKDGKAISFRKWLSDSIMPALRAKSSMIRIWYSDGGILHLVGINNPFVSGGTAAYDVTISNDVLVKFWNVLANNPQIFTIAGMTGVQHQGDTASVVADSKYNVLDLAIVETEVQGETKDAVKIGEQFVTEYSKETGEANYSLVGTDDLYIQPSVPASLELSNTFVVAEG